VSSVSLKKDTKDSEGSRRGSAVSGKDGKESPDRQKENEGEKPADSETKEPDTSPNGGPKLDEGEKGDNDKDAGDEPSPEEKDKTDTDNGKKEENEKDGKVEEESKTDTEKPDENDLANGAGDKTETEKGPSPEVPPENQKEPEEEKKENVKDNTDAEVKEEEKPPSPEPKPLTPEPQEEEKGNTNSDTSNPKDNSKNDRKEESVENSETDREKDKEKSSVGDPEKAADDRSRSQGDESKDTSGDVTAPEPKPETPSNDSTKQADEGKPDTVERDGDVNDSKDDKRERAKTPEKDNSDRTDGAPDESKIKDQVDNVQSRENTEVEGAEESGFKQDPKRKESLKEKQEREATPRKRSTPTPRTPISRGESDIERNVPNHPSSRSTQRETSEPRMRERTPAKEPPKRGRNKDYPGKPIRVEDPPKKVSNKNAPRRDKEKPPPDNTKYKPTRSRKSSDVSDPDTYRDRGLGNRGGNRVDWEERMGKTSRMGPKKGQNYSDDPNSDLETRTPRSKSNRGLYPYSTGKSPRYEGPKNSPRYEVPKKSPRYKAPSPNVEDSDSSDPFLKFDRNSEDLADLEKDTMNILDVIRNMQDENRRAMAENSKLREKNLKLHQTVGELKEEMDELCEEKKDFEQQLAEEGKKDNYVRKLERDLINAEHDRQKYLAKIQIMEDELRKQQRKIQDKDTEITVAIGELQKLQKVNDKLMGEMMNLSGRSLLQKRLVVTEVNDVGTQTFHSDTMTENVGLVEILKQEISSLKDYNAHLQKSLREEMSRRELVQSLLDDVMNTNEGFRKHVVKMSNRDSEVDALTAQLREMEASQRKLMTENAQLKASLAVLEAQKQNDDAIEEILSGRSSKRDKGLEKRLEDMERKLRVSEQRVFDLEGYLDEIYDNDDVKIVIKSNITNTSLPALPSVYPDRNKPSAFNKLDMNAYNSYARLAKNRSKFSKRF
jgi:hypothetical protein